MTKKPSLTSEQYRLVLARMKEIEAEGANDQDKPDITAHIARLTTDEVSEERQARFRAWLQEHLRDEGTVEAKPTPTVIDLASFRAKALERKTRPPACRPYPRRAAAAAAPRTSKPTVGHMPEISWGQAEGEFALRTENGKIRLEGWSAGSARLCWLTSEGKVEMRELDTASAMTRNEFSKLLVFAMANPNQSVVYLEGG